MKRPAAAAWRPLCAAASLIVGACAPFGTTDSQPRSFAAPVQADLGPDTPDAARPTLAFPASGIDVSPPVALRALHSFRQSCPVITARPDRAALTLPGDWAGPCRAAARWPDDRATRFFRTRFRPVIAGDGAGRITGYFLPEIAAARDRRPGFAVPIYGPVTDMGPLPDRAAIAGGALAGLAPVVAWAADPVDLFFLQIQGSGRLRLPDGSVIGVGYAGHNGRGYVAIGRVLVARGLLTADRATMPAIAALLRAQADGGAALMAENPRYVFFRETAADAAVGTIGVPLTAQASAAIDPAVIPYGTPLLVSAAGGAAAGLWIAQDSGGAIRGANRIDSYWGAGDAAADVAGRLNVQAGVTLLLPRASVRRLERQVRRR